MLQVGRVEARKNQLATLAAVERVPGLTLAVAGPEVDSALAVKLRASKACRVLGRVDDPTLELRPMLDFQAGYVQRSVDMFPRQGSHGPWTVAMSYAADRARLRKGPVEDPGLRFSRSTPALVVAA